MTQSERIKYLTEPEILKLRQIAESRAIVDLAHGRRTGVIEWLVIDIASSLGLRATELRSLRVGDVHLTNRSYLDVLTLKRRQRVLDQLPVEGQLRGHLKAYLQWKASAGESLDASSSLLISNKGHGFSLRGIEYLAKRLMASTGLDPRFSIHSLRHTTAVHLLRKTKNLRLVQKVLRHASIATTEQYGQVLESDMREGLAGLF
jgi:integrase/recombinase XerD